MEVELAIGKISFSKIMSFDLTESPMELQH